jgi:hypothetical protein
VTARCQTCPWEGPSTSVVDGGLCPECAQPVRYDSKPLQSAPQLTQHEFNLRAARALKAAGIGQIPTEFAAIAIHHAESGRAMTPAMQKGFITPSAATTTRSTTGR